MILVYGFLAAAAALDACFCVQHGFQIIVLLVEFWVISAAFAVFYAAQLVISLFYDSATPAIRPRPYSVWLMEQTPIYLLFLLACAYMCPERSCCRRTENSCSLNHRSNFDPIVVTKQGESLRRCLRVKA